MTNLLDENVKELLKEYYYEYLEEGYESFEAMELARKDVADIRGQDIDEFNSLYENTLKFE
jgi:hypothetical protein|tara:strand:+ start:464 stop:646 length:183 start_codon:yes stop_codon:yes gene_type:complete